MEYKKALSKCMNYSSKAEYCTYDISKKMETWGINFDDRDTIIETLIRENFINEERYVNAYVRDKFKFNRWGKIKITYMLKQKEIASVLIETALKSIEEDNYCEIILEELAKKIKSTKGKDEYDKKAKVIRSMLSRGFESEILYSLYDKQVNNY